MHTLVSPRCSAEADLLEVTVVELRDTPSTMKSDLKLTFHCPHILVLLLRAREVRAIVTTEEGDPDLALAALSAL